MHVLERHRAEWRLRQGFGVLRPLDGGLRRKDLAEAFRSGNLGVFDYYKLKNIQADTGMREAIARPSDGKGA